MSLSAEQIQRIQRLEFRMRRSVNTSLAGAYHSVFKGRGIAFDSVRPYQPGDDVRTIDWNVTARSNDPYVKAFSEERELTVMILLDASRSLFFGTQGRQKRDLAAELGAALTLTAIRNNDKVGLLAVSDQIEQILPPAKNRTQALQVIRETLSLVPNGRETRLAIGFQTASRLLKQRAIVFVLSDFLETPSRYRRELLTLAQRHDVIALTLQDPLEIQWPDIGLVALHDAETGDITIVDTSSEGWREAFKDRWIRFVRQRDALFSQARIDHVTLTSNDDTVNVLLRFFQRRERRIRK